MIVRFASEFRIELLDVPDTIAGFLKDEIGEHIVVDDAGEKPDMIVEFRDSIDFEGRVKYIVEKFTAGFNDKHFYLLDREKNKLEVKDFREKKVIHCEKSFNPESFFEILEYFYMQKILDDNLMFLHSSGMTVNGKTILFPAYRGTGKTKILVQMMRRYNANFIGDDWTIIDGKGNAYPYYRRLGIGLSDILENRDFFKDYPVVIPSESKGVPKGISGFPKRVWAYMLYVVKPLIALIKPPAENKMSLPMMLKASEIKKDNIVDYKHINKIDYVVLVSRCNSRKISCKPIDSAALAEKVIYTILSEDALIKPDFENWASFAGHSDPAAREKRIAQMKAIMRGCFEKTNNLWLEIPLEAPSGEVADFIVSSILELKT